MAEICIYIPLEPYLRDWFIHLHGGNYPVRLMRGCAESDVLAKALMRQPEGEPIPKPEEGDVAIVIPQFRHRDPVYFNYLPKHGKLALLQVIRHNFDFDMWSDLHRFGYIGSRRDHLIYNFMETKGKPFHRNKLSTNLLNSPIMEKLLSHLQFTDSVVERLRELGYDNTDDFEDEVLAHHADYRDENPSVYCGTYHKYNCGSLAGYQKIDIIKIAL